MSHPALPDMAWQLRRLLEVVKEACASESRWGWLVAPVALLTWFRTRRQRREAVEAMQAVQGMLEAFLGLVEDLRSGKLAPQDVLPEEAARAPVGRRCGVLRADAVMAPRPPCRAESGRGGERRERCVPRGATSLRRRRCRNVMDSRLRGNDGYGGVALVLLRSLAVRARAPPEAGFAKIVEGLCGLAWAIRYDNATKPLGSTADCRAIGSPYGDS
jgi:hypothetical protein